MGEAESTQMDECDRHSEGKEQGAVRRAGGISVRVCGFSETVALTHRLEDLRREERRQ